MSRYRDNKNRLRGVLEGEGWREALAGLDGVPPRELIGPLFSALLQPGAARWRAAAALGRVTARLADEDMEAARVVARRIMWHMNEESGNLGWGMPESLGEILACQAGLAEEFSKILLSYVRDTGGEDNFVDHAPLRRAAFLAVGRFAAARPALAGPALESLIQGLRDEDEACRGCAAWALGELFRRMEVDSLRGPEREFLKRAAGDLRVLRASAVVVELFEDDALTEARVGEVAGRVLNLPILREVSRTE